LLGSCPIYMLSTLVESQISKILKNELLPTLPNFYSKV